MDDNNKTFQLLLYITVLFLFWYQKRTDETHRKLHGKKSGTLLFLYLSQSILAEKKSTHEIFPDRDGRVCEYHTYAISHRSSFYLLNVIIFSPKTITVFYAILTQLLILRLTRKQLIFYLRVM